MSNFEIVVSMKYGVALVRTINDVVDVTDDMQEPLHYLRPKRVRTQLRWGSHVTTVWVPERPALEPVDLEERSEARIVDLDSRRNKKPVVTKARIEKRYRVARLRPAVYENLEFFNGLESERLRFPGFIPEDTKPTAPRRKHNTGRKPMKRYTRDSIRTAA